MSGCRRIVIDKCEYIQPIESREIAPLVIGYRLGRSFGGILFGFDGWIPRLYGCEGAGLIFRVFSLAIAKRKILMFGLIWQQA